MSILSILLNLQPGCHNPTPLEDRHPVGQPKLGTSPLGYVRTSSTDIHVLYVKSSTVICVPYVQLIAYVPYRDPPRGPAYVQLAAYVLYHVPPRGPTHYVYIPMPLTLMLSDLSQLTRTCP
jgi:hypothetical protein